MSNRHITVEFVLGAKYGAIVYIDESFDQDLFDYDFILPDRRVLRFPTSWQILQPRRAIFPHSRAFGCFQTGYLHQLRPHAAKHRQIRHALHLDFTKKNLFHLSTHLVLRSPDNQLSSSKTHQQTWLATNQTPAASELQHVQPRRTRRLRVIGYALHWTAPHLAASASLSCTRVIGCERVIWCFVEGHCVYCNSLASTDRVNAGPGRLPHFGVNGLSLSVYLHQTLPKLNSHHAPGDTALKQPRIPNPSANYTPTQAAGVGIRCGKVLVLSISMASMASSI